MKIEQIEELLRLKKENPELKIVYMVDNEVCGGDDFRYWQARIEKIKKGIYILKEEQIFTDMDDFEEVLNIELWDDEKSDEENTKIIEKEINKYDKKEAIIIYLGV